jgi:two-component system response regulator NreC
MSTPIKVIIADDHELYLDGLRMMLSKVPEVVVIGEAKNGIQLVNNVQEQEPDVVLTDIIMPLMDGITAVKKIHEINPAIGTVALSMFNEENYIRDMLEAGAMGYLIKNANKEEIIEAIRTVAKGHPYYCKNTSFKLKKLIATSQFNPYKNRRPLFLTKKEVEIIQLLCQEKTNKEIGKQLFISARTVEGYRQKIQDKMNVKSTTGLVIYAIKTGIYKLDSMQEYPK